jgi:hypothetical protein
MRPKNKLALFVLIAISSFCIFGMPYKDCLAQQKQLNFEKNIYYDIYYQVENHVQYVANVKIIDTATIGGTTFLVIQSSSLPTENSGYISVANVIAILPAGSPKPQENK